MKKSTQKPLIVRSETIRVLRTLSPRDLAQVAGGVPRDEQSAE